jgi:succinate dehydrogenase / fumarate reductase, membrane anchor subunit
MTLRTPLKEVRRLGSAKEGTDHFWKQRLTGIANVFLGLFLVWLVASLAGADQAAVKSLIAKPWVSLPLALLVVSGAVHMKLGMQTIIEDYVHAEAVKISLLLLNTFFAVSVGAATIFAVLKLSFGG